MYDTYLASCNHILHDVLRSFIPLFHINSKSQLIDIKYYTAFCGEWRYLLSEKSGGKQCAWDVASRRIRVLSESLLRMKAILLRVNPNHIRINPNHIRIKWTNLCVKILQNDILAGWKRRTSCMETSQMTTAKSIGANSDYRIVRKILSWHSDQVKTTMVLFLIYHWYVTLLCVHLYCKA